VEIHLEAYSAAPASRESLTARAARLIAFRRQAEATTRCCHPPLRLLPEDAGSLLEDLRVPPRLAAHLRLVHDVACRLADWADARHPALGYDRDAMLFGAATHDIGKAAFPAEITGPGSAHEEAGRQLLLSAGVSARLARFAASHASWDDPGTGVEDLMVSVADKAWKNKRVPDLENLLVTRLAQASGKHAWQELADLDTLLEAIGDGADDRLAFQSSFPATPT
jgi:hypothetical protein